MVRLFHRDRSQNTRCCRCAIDAQRKTLYESARSAVHIRPEFLGKCTPKNSDRLAIDCQWQRAMVDSKHNIIKKKEYDMHRKAFLLLTVIQIVVCLSACALRKPTEETAPWISSDTTSESGQNKADSTETQIVSVIKVETL